MTKTNDVRYLTFLFAQITYTSDWLTKINCQTNLDMHKIFNRVKSNRKTEQNRDTRRTKSTNLNRDMRMFTTQVDFNIRRKMLLDYQVSLV